MKRNPRPHGPQPEDETMTMNVVGTIMICFVLGVIVLAGLCNLSSDA